MAAGTGEEHRLDLGSPEEEPVVTHVPELSLIRQQMGCRGSRQGCEELGEGLSTGGLSPVPLSLWPLPHISNNNSSSQLAVSHGGSVFTGRGSPLQIYFSDQK